MIDAVQRQIRRALAGIRWPFRSVGRDIDLSALTQRVNIDGLAPEQIAALELLQQFGLVTAPPDGAQYVVLPLGGKTSASVLIASDHAQYRFVLSAKGEAALHNQWGDVVHMRADRSVHVKAQAKVQLEAPVVECSQDLLVKGNILAEGNVVADGDVSDQGGTKSMAAMRQAYDQHSGHHTPGSTPDVGM